jgi:hypothetical protein
VTSAAEAVKLITDELLPMWQKERKKLDRIDKWARWDHDRPHKPRRQTNEYKELGARAQAPWGDLIVRSVAQTLYVEGYGRADTPSPDDVEVDPKAPPLPEPPADPEKGPDLSVPGAHGWHIWQANGMDGRQVPVFMSMLTYGLTYGMSLPGKTLTGERMPVMRGVSPREMIAVYEDPAWDDWPAYALRVARVRGGYRLELFDDAESFSFKVKDLGDRIASKPKVSEHEAGVCPIVRFKNRFDLEGRAVGEIEPFIPLLGRIDQTTFDRLVVQRFAAWIVRTIAGMSVTESAAASGESTEQVKMRLAVEDFLTAEDKDTKFGSLPATQLDGFIKAQDADKIDLAATTQTAAFELLGQLANISADGLQAVKSSQDAKSDEKKHTTGVDIEQWLRLSCWVAGDKTGAADFKSQVRWADTSIRSLNGAADGLGKLAKMLGIPPQVLWTKVPTLTQQDIDEAKAIVEKNGGLAQLFGQITNGVDPTPGIPAAA